MLRASIVPLLLLSGSLLSAKSHVAERYDVRIRVLPDATLNVTETVRFHFEGGDYTYVVRDVSKRGLDRISGLLATMDGHPADADIRDNSRAVRVRWNFHGPAGSTHNFTLSYRVEGAARQQAGRAILLWHAIPEEHDYPILGGNIDIEYPRDAVMAPPDVPGATQARYEDSHATFTLPQLPQNRGAGIRLAFRASALPPSRSEDEFAARSRAALNWRAGAVAFLLAVATALALIRH